MSTDPRPVRVALAAGILFGIAYLLAVPLFRPEQVGVATDVYYLAAERALAGDSPYLVSPADHPGFQFLYHPVVLLAFLPHDLTGSAHGAYLLQTLLNLATAAAIGVLLVRTIEDAGVVLERIDRLLVAGFALASVHSVSVSVMGQVNLQLALAVVAGGLLIDRGHRSLGGAAFATAATVKLFPAVLGVWLVRRRAWSAVAVAAATVTGVALLLAGVLAFGPSLFGTYLTAVLPSERHAAEFAGGLPPSSMFLSAVISYPAVAGLLAIAPIGPGMEGALAAGARGVFRVAQPPLVGALSLLAGCGLFQYEAATGDVATRRVEPFAE